MCVPDSCAVRRRDFHDQRQRIEDLEVTAGPGSSAAPLRQSCTPQVLLQLCNEQCHLPHLSTYSSPSYTKPHPFARHRRALLKIAHRATGSPTPPLHPYTGPTAKSSSRSQSSRPATTTANSVLSILLLSHPTAAFAALSIASPCALKSFTPTPSRVYIKPLPAVVLAFSHLQRQVTTSSRHLKTLGLLCST